MNLLVLFKGQTQGRETATLKNVFFYSLIGCFVLLSLTPPALGETFEPRAHYKVCFTPTHDCTSQIVDVIQQAQHTLYMQAYSFTSKPILDALLAAKKRHVEVKVILDKSHLAHLDVAQQLVKHHIPVWIDSRSSGIAHNKVIIIDEAQIVTGSFNFSYAAQHKNRENVLFIHDKALAGRYLENWYNCQLKSEPLPAQKSKKAPKQKDMIAKEKYPLIRNTLFAIILISIAIKLLSNF